eukprot:SAG11_NODE_34392_length_272_cov_0.601156_1_plen_72_part_10
MPLLWYIQRPIPVGSAVPAGSEASHTGVTDPAAALCCPRSCDMSAPAAFCPAQIVMSVAQKRLATAAAQRGR